jgi:molybdopterin converting factor subunit 1
MSAREIRVDVRLFAAPREVLRSGRVTARLAEGATVDELLDRLVQEHPALAGYRPHLQVAVNRAVVAAQTRLHDGDEVALLPPVGGG